jgi:hypothetical protein
MSDWCEKDVWSGIVEKTAEMAPHDAFPETKGNCCTNSSSMFPFIYIAIASGSCKMNGGF